MRAWTLTRIVDIDRITVSKRRKLVFLELDGDKEVNARKAYEGLSSKAQKHLCHSFQRWVDGIAKRDRHHGFNASQHNGAYTECYVFKHDQDRLFGFICHPDPDNPRQEYCVLVHMPKRKKSQHEADTRVLDLVNRISAMPEVRTALSDYVSAL